MWPVVALGNRSTGPEGFPMRTCPDCQKPPDTESVCFFRLTGLDEVRRGSQSSCFRLMIVLIAARTEAPMLSMHTVHHVNHLFCHFHLIIFVFVLNFGVYRHILEKGSISTFVPQARATSVPATTDMIRWMLGVEAAISSFRRISTS